MKNYNKQNSKKIQKMINQNNLKLQNKFKNRTFNNKMN